MSGARLQRRLAALEAHGACPTAPSGIVVIWLNEEGDTRAMALQRAGWTPVMLTYTIVLYVEYEEERSDVL
jgi:hypothetical protein